MLNQLGIPEEELRQFKPFVQFYTKGKVIVQEGDVRDQRIFLLRQGEVEVIKKIGDCPQVLDHIRSVNFFGEMAVVSQQPRTATIIAATDPVIVYAFDNLSITSILANPTWGPMLVRRLADNLKDSLTRYEDARLQGDKWRKAISELVGAILNLYAVAGDDENTRQTFLEALPKLISTHLQGLGVNLTIPDQSRLELYRRRGIITEKLYSLAIATRSKLKGEKPETDITSGQSLK